MKLFIINGPNLNMLGVREPEIYGNVGYDDLIRQLKDYCAEREIQVSFFQSNHEGDLVDYIQKAYYDVADGIIINPGAYTHTSLALFDAVKAVKIPTVEIHISDPDTRDEEIRKISYIRKACVKTIKGHGLDGYFEAIDHFYENEE